MAYFIMLPQTQSGTNQWEASTGTDFVDIVDEDNDLTYIYETRSGQEINYIMTDPSVSEGSIDFDEDVTVTPRVRAHHTGTGGANLQVDLQGLGIGYTQNTEAIANDNSYPVYSYNSTTNKTVGTPWDYSGLQTVTIELKCLTNLARGQALRVSYFYLRVDYTEAVVVANNATFFGANF